jgi:hypothetical protein
VVLNLAISNGEAILIIVFAAIPVAAATFALGSGRAYKQIGKGQFSVEFEHDIPQKMSDSGTDAGAAAAIRDAELRQLLEAKAFRQSERGESPLDVDVEMERIRTEEISGAPPGEDPGLVEEVRQLVLARNARRVRRGEEPLDVEAEVRRQLQELESLGQ